jgi:limonene-1,2-epoxide hydrolase
LEDKRRLVASLHEVEGVMSPTEQVESYAKAWRKHVAANDSTEGRTNLEAFLAWLSPEVRYEDIPAGSRHRGHDEVAAMCKMVSAFGLDLAINSAQGDGERFAFEYTISTTNAQNGDAIVVRAVAVGTLHDGKVTSHRDYYDPRPFPAPSAR